MVIPNRPNDILVFLEEFTGRIIHSSEVNNFEMMSKTSFNSWGRSLM